MSSDPQQGPGPSLQAMYNALRGEDPNEKIIRDVLMLLTGAKLKLEKLLKR